MTETYALPIISHDKQKWGCLSYHSHTAEICGEKINTIDNNYSFKGGHRVRLFKIKGNVHWKIPGAIVVDIKDVEPSPDPPARRHHK